MENQNNNEEDLQENLPILANYIRIIEEVIKKKKD